MSTNSRVKAKQLNQKSDLITAYPTVAISKQKKIIPDYSSVYRAIREIGFPINLFDLKRFYNLY